MLTIKLTASTLDELATAVTAYLIEFDPYVWGAAATQQGQQDGVYFAIMTRNDTPK
jgi:hypothetical protein